MSNNKLSSVPAIPQLADLTTLNIALNSLQVAAPGSRSFTWLMTHTCPLQGDLNIGGVEQCAKLTVVDVSGKLLALATQGPSSV